MKAFITMKIAAWLIAKIRGNRVNVHFAFGVHWKDSC